MSPTADDVRALASLLRARSTGSPLSASRPEHAPWVRVLDGLRAGVDVLGALRGLEFRPFLLLNGLRHAATLEEEGLRFTCGALASGLEEFAGFFAARGGADLETLAAEQHRYFAWLLAQWPECGIGLEGVLMTMKGDAVDQGTAYEVRAVLEGGPGALLASDLFDEEEKAAFQRVFDQRPGAGDAFRDLLVRRWKLPVALRPGAAH